MLFPATPAKRIALAAAFVLPMIAMAQTLQVSLTPSNYNGYHVSCFGGQDGVIAATPTGGAAPYTYSWSTNQDTPTITDLPAGYYRVKVSDSANNTVEAEITLTEPTSMKVTATPHVFGNGYNISCYECSNGSIQLAVAHGVPPYSFQWDDGPTNQNRWALDQGTYKVTVSDANGCEALQADAYISRPERSDWTMGGNAGTDPATDFIGTADAQDLVFKSNGTERLRITSTGEIKLVDANGEMGPLYVDADGVLKRGGFNDGPPPYPGPGCTHLHTYPYWKSSGNTFPTTLCPDEPPILGTLNEHPLRVYTNNLQRMVVTTDGKVGIGTTPPSGAINGYRLFVNDGIATRDVLVKLGAWPDYVFGADYDLMPMPELRGFLQENHHLPGIPSAAEVDEKGGVEVGDLQKRMLEVVEQQALYILQLEERMARLEQRLATPQTSK